MAKSKSTTTPTKASSSKTKDKDHTGGHRSSRTNVSTRSASAQSSPSKRKADDHDGGSRSSKRRAVADDDAASSTSQRDIPVRPARSKGKGKEVAKSELELFKERHNSLFPREVTVKRETPDVEPEPEPDADNVCVRPPSPIKPDDKEKLLDYVLLGTFGYEARQHAVDQLFEAARESATSKTDFGFTYVEATVSRLKRKGIKEQRLTEVLTMLQDGLCEQVRARVDSFSGPLSLPSPLSLPQDFGQAAAETSNNANRIGVSDVLESRQSPVVLPHKGKQRSARSVSVHTPSDSDSSSDDDETVVPGSQRNSKFRDDDDEDYFENSNPSVPHREHVKHEDGPARAPINNFRVYGTRHTNGRPFDHYARAAISAYMPAPDDATADATAMRIRGEALILWRRVSKKDKAGWRVLFEARNSDPKVYKKGLRLLRRQGYLAKLQAKCQHIVNSADAGPSRPPPPALLEPPKVSTAASRDAPSAGHISDQPSCPPAPTLSEHTTTTHLGCGDIANAQVPFDRSYSPPERILSEHALPESTPVAHPRFKDTACAQNSPNRVKSSPDLVRSEITLTKLPRSNNDVSRQSSSDNSSSSASPEPTPSDPTLVAHSGSKGDVDIQSTPSRTSFFPEHLAAVYSSSEDDASIQSTSDRSASPTPTISGRTPSVNPKFTATVGTKSKPGITRLASLFPFLNRATSTTSPKRACYVQFAPRKGKRPSLFYVVNTPVVQTKRRLSDRDAHLACKAFGDYKVNRCKKNLLIVSFADMAALEAVKRRWITLPSPSGQTVAIEPSTQGLYPSRVFSCDEDLPIKHATVGPSVLRALRGPATGPRASFDLLKQQTEHPQIRRTRYLIGFRFGVHPPCSPWMQSIYIPVQSERGTGKVWVEFRPENVNVRCAFCGEGCQQVAGHCPFVDVILRQHGT